MIFKCKMCGGDIESISNNIGKCLYCKSEMTLPNLDNDRLLNLYNRANDLRLSNNFDKAKDIYESILQIDNEQIEAYWGILLCKYGVEYVDDPKTNTKIPTCHRTSDESILIDQNFKKIKRESHGDVLELYEKEAKQIDEIQKRILSKVKITEKQTKSIKKILKFVFVGFVVLLIIDIISLIICFTRKIGPFAENKPKSNISSIIQKDK